MVAAFDAGATAEEIAQQYPSVALADVYSVITYYLRHQFDVYAYLQKRRQLSLRAAGNLTPFASADHVGRATAAALRTCG
jgi:uncharacterized protein DUF433